MPVFFSGIGSRIPGGVGVPEPGCDPVEYLRHVPPDSLVVIGPDEEDRYAFVRRPLRAGVRDDVRLVRVPLLRSTMALTALVMYRGGMPAGAVAAVAGLVGTSVSTTVLISGVAGMGRPRPSPAVRALGPVPGVRFVLDVPGDRVRRCGRRVVVPLPGTGPVLTVATSGEDPTSLRWCDQLEAATGAVEQVRMADAAPSRWRARTWAEITVAPRRLDSFSRWIRGRLRLRTCHWCGALVAGSPCVYCGVTATPAAAVGIPGRLPTLLPREGSGPTQRQALGLTTTMPLPGAAR